MGKNYKNQRPRRKLYLLLAVLLLVLLVEGVLCLFFLGRGKKSAVKEGGLGPVAEASGAEGASTEVSSNSASSNTVPGESVSEDTATKPVVSLSEAEYMEMYDGAEGLYIRDHYYDDFDGDGVSEFFFIRSKTEGWRARYDELSNEIDNNGEYDADEYDGLKSEPFSVCFADGSGMKVLYEAISRDEYRKVYYDGMELVEGDGGKYVIVHCGTYTGEFTGFVYDTPGDIVLGMKNGQGTLIREFEESFIEIADDQVYVHVPTGDNWYYERNPGRPLYMTYPVIFSGGECRELTSDAIDKRILNAFDNWKQVYREVIDTIAADGVSNGRLGFEYSKINYRRIEIENVLYHADGKLYVNYKAEGTIDSLEPVVEGEGLALDYLEDIRFMAVLTPQGRHISQVQVLGGNRMERYFAPMEAVKSDRHQLLAMLKIREEDIASLGNVTRMVDCTVMNPEELVDQGDRYLLQGSIKSGDNSESVSLVVDDDTTTGKGILTSGHSGVYEGMTGKAFIDSLIADPYDEGLGVYRVDVTGDHVDMIYGLYWWD